MAKRRKSAKPVKQALLFSDFLHTLGDFYATPSVEVKEELAKKYIKKQDATSNKTFADFIDFKIDKVTVNGLYLLLMSDWGLDFLMNHPQYYVTPSASALHFLCEANNTFDQPVLAFFRTSKWSSFLQKFPDFLDNAECNLLGERVILSAKSQTLAMDEPQERGAIMARNFLRQQHLDDDHIFKQLLKPEGLGFLSTHYLLIPKLFNKRQFNQFTPLELMPIIHLIALHANELALLWTPLQKNWLEEYYPQAFVKTSEKANHAETKNTLNLKSELDTISNDLLKSKLPLSKDMEVISIIRDFSTFITKLPSASAAPSHIYSSTYMHNGPFARVNGFYLMMHSLFLMFLMENPEYYVKPTADELHFDCRLRINNQLFSANPAFAFLRCNNSAEFLRKFPDFLDNLDFERLEQAKPHVISSLYDASGQQKTVESIEFVDFFTKELGRNKAKFEAILKLPGCMALLKRHPLLARVLMTGYNPELFVPFLPEESVFLTNTLTVSQRAYLNVLHTQLYQPEEASTAYTHINSLNDIVLHERRMDAPMYPEQEGDLNKSTLSQTLPHLSAHIEANADLALTIDDFYKQAFIEKGVVNAKLNALYLFMTDDGLNLLIAYPQFYRKPTAEMLHFRNQIEVYNITLGISTAFEFFRCKNWPGFIHKFPDFLDNLDYSQLLNEITNLPAWIYNFAQVAPLLAGQKLLSLSFKEYISENKIDRTQFAQALFSSSNGVLALLTNIPYVTWALCYMHDFKEFNIVPILPVIRKYKHFFFREFSAQQLSWIQENHPDVFESCVRLGTTPHNGIRTDSFSIFFEKAEPFFKKQFSVFMELLDSHSTLPLEHFLKKYFSDEDNFGIVYYFLMNPFGMQLLIKNPRFYIIPDVEMLNQTCFYDGSEDVPVLAALRARNWKQFITKFPSFLDNIDFTRLGKSVKVVSKSGESKMTVIHAEHYFSKEHMQDERVVKQFREKKGGIDFLLEHPHLVPMMCQDRNFSKFDIKPFIPVIEQNAERFYNTWNASQRDWLAKHYPDCLPHYLVTPGYISNSKMQRGLPKNAELVTSEGALSFKFPHMSAPTRFEAIALNSLMPLQKRIKQGELVDIYPFTLNAVALDATGKLYYMNTEAFDAFNFKVLSARGNAHEMLQDDPSLILSARYFISLGFKPDEPLEAALKAYCPDIFSPRTGRLRHCDFFKTVTQDHVSRPSPSPDVTCG